MSDALEWLEAHRGKPLTTSRYIERDVEPGPRERGW
jgi:hypothetical protein